MKCETLLPIHRLNQQQGSSKQTNKRSLEMLGSKLLRNSIGHAIRASSRTLTMTNDEYEAIKARVRTGNAFKLFQVEEKLKIDERKLKREMHKLQRAFHPDKLISSGREPTNFTDNVSTIVNQAYQTLRDPYLRAKYLLEVKLNKSPDSIEMSLDAVKLDPDFLDRMMDLQERVVTDSANTVYKLGAQINSELEELIAMIDRDFESENYESVLRSLAKLKFLARCQSSIRQRLGDYT